MHARGVLFFFSLKGDSVQKTYCVRVTIEGNTLSDCDRASEVLISRSNAVSPIPISTHGKCTKYELVPEQPTITMQEQPKESMSIAAIGVAVISGLGFLVGLMF